MRLRSVIALMAGAVLLTACRQRQVQVRTSPTTQAQVAVQVNNNLAQAVNVYVVSSGTETFLRQVNANSSATIPVQGVASGAAVDLKAVTADGARTYSRKSVVLNGTYVFPLP
jgi:hypothetical protein